MAILRLINDSVVDVDFEGQRLINGVIVEGAGSAGFTQNVTLSGLTPSTTYYIHYVQKDAAGNTSNVVTSASFTTDAAASVISDIFYRTLLSGASL